jgi:hypothetical protein
MQTLEETQNALLNLLIADVQEAWNPVNIHTDPPEDAKHDEKDYPIAYILMSDAVVLAEGENGGSLCSESAKARVLFVLESAISLHEADPKKRIRLRIAQQLRDKVLTAANYHGFNRWHVRDVYVRPGEISSGNRVFGVAVEIDYLLEYSN